MDTSALLVDKASDITFPDSLREGTIEHIRAKQIFELASELLAVMNVLRAWWLTKYKREASQRSDACNGIPIVFVVVRVFIEASAPCLEAAIHVNVHGKHGTQSSFLQSNERIDMAFKLVTRKVLRNPPMVVHTNRDPHSVLLQMIGHTNVLRNGRA